MRVILLTSAAILGLSTSIVFAGEGNGDPFPSPDQGVTTVVGPTRMKSADADPFPFRANTNVAVVTEYKPLAAKDADPFPFRMHDRVAFSSAPPSNMVAGKQETPATNAQGQATASSAAPSSVAQRTVAPAGTHG